MTRKQALAELIAKVEAGDNVGFRKANRAVFSTPCQDMNLQLREENCRHAFHGSLDAAKALHEAVLGEGYTAQIWMHGPAYLEHTEHARKDKSATCHGNPARAWLLAILKALHTQETDK